jgi:hypothetical protein
MAGIERRAIVEDFLVLEGQRDGHALRLGQPGQRRAPRRGFETAAGHDQRPFGAGQQRRRPRDLVGAGTRARPLDRGRRLGRDRVGQHVLRQGDHHRPRGAGAGGAPGPAQRFAELAGMLHLPHALGDAAEHLAVIDLLESAAAAFVSGDLTDQDD